VRPGHATARPLCCRRWYAHPECPGAWGSHPH